MMFERAVTLLLLCSSSLLLWLNSAEAFTLNFRPPTDGASWREVLATVGSLKLEANRWKIIVAPADLPNDLEGIRACRIQAFVDETGNEPKKMLSSQINFLNAEDAITGRSICLVAKDRVPPCRVLGTLDLQSRRDGSVLIQNVFVAPEARGNGLATRLVREAEQLAIETSDRMVLSVDTNNRPAVNLYQKCSYETKGLDAVILAISRVTGVNLVMDMKKHLL